MVLDAAASLWEQSTCRTAKNWGHASSILKKVLQYTLCFRSWHRILPTLTSFGEGILTLLKAKHQMQYNHAVLVTMPLDKVSRFLTSS